MADVSIVLYRRLLNNKLCRLTESFEIGTNMDRQTRIRIVIGAAVTLLGLFFAFIGAPLVAQAFWPDASSANDVDGMMQAMTQASRTAQIASRISVIALVVSLMAFVYSLAIVAIWFIKFADKTKLADD